jgi:oxygen-dependent protoporphyrinogen oxidase
MSGIYAGDGDRLSLQATLPYLRDLELKYGGLVKGALAVRKERAKKAKANSNGNAPRPNPGSRSIFLTPLTGLAEIVEQLVSALEDAGADMRLNSRVKCVQPDKVKPGAWRVILEDGVCIATDGVILATPAFVSGALIENFAPELAPELTAIEYVSTATVTLAFRASELPCPLDGYGYVIPRRAGRKALACTWTSTKFPHRAPEGYALVRVFVGRAGQEKQITWNDGALLEIARQELELTLGITSEPLLTRIFQWEKAMPQYNLGHPERLDRINTGLDDFPGLGLAGNGYLGIGIPDCIHSGELALEKVLQS